MRKIVSMSLRKLLGDIEEGVPPDPVRRNKNVKRVDTKEALQYFVKLCKEYGLELRITNDVPPDELKNRKGWLHEDVYYTWLWDNFTILEKQAVHVRFPASTRALFAIRTVKGDYLEVLIHKDTWKKLNEQDKRYRTLFKTPSGKRVMNFRRTKRGFYYMRYRFLAPSPSRMRRLIELTIAEERKRLQKLRERQLYRINRDRWLTGRMRYDERLVEKKALEERKTKIYIDGLFYEWNPKKETFVPMIPRQPRLIKPDEVVEEKTEDEELDELPKGITEEEFDKQRFENQETKRRIIKREVAN